MKKRIIILGTHDYTLGRRLAEIVAKFRLSDVIKSDADLCRCPKPKTGKVGNFCHDCKKYTY